MARSATLPPEPLAELLGNTPWAQPESEGRDLPSANCLLVGASLLSGLRPFARDMSASLCPPGSDDETLEQAAERLLQSDPALVHERLEVEANCGFSMHPDGYVEIAGARVPREGVAKQLRLAWVTVRAPKTLIALPHWHDLGRWRSDAPLVLIHHPGIQEQPPLAWRCAHTGAQVPLLGTGKPQTIDRTAAAPRAVFAALDDLAHRGAQIAISGSRRPLYDIFAKRVFRPR
jgi:hypothetical protein